MKVDSTINNSSYYNSDADDVEDDPKSDPLVNTHNSDGKKGQLTDSDTNNRNYPQNLLINRTHLMIVPPIDLRVAGGVSSGRGTTHTRQTPTLKVIVTDAARSGAPVFWT